MDNQEGRPESRAGASRPAGAGSASVVVVISSNTMGRGDDELGRVLIRSHLHALGEVTPKPDTVVLFNTGVLLAAEGAPELEGLKSLIEHEVRVILCGTCVSHFDLKDRIAVGEVSNMYAITETMMRARKVINL